MRNVSSVLSRRGITLLAKLVFFLTILCARRERLLPAFADQERHKLVSLHVWGFCGLRTLNNSQRSRKLRPGLCAALLDVAPSKRSQKIQVGAR